MVYKMMAGKRSKNENELSIFFAMRGTKSKTRLLKHTEFAGRTPITDSVIDSVIDSVTDSVIDTVIDSIMEFNWPFK